MLCIYMITMVWSRRASELKFSGKENLETTLNMMLQPGTVTQQEREKLARNQKGNIVERRVW